MWPCKDQDELQTKNKDFRRVVTLVENDTSLYLSDPRYILLFINSKMRTSTVLHFNGRLIFKFETKLEYSCSSC